MRTKQYDLSTVNYDATRPASWPDNLSGTFELVEAEYYVRRGITAHDAAAGIIRCDASANSVAGRAESQPVKQSELSPLKLARRILRRGTRRQKMAWNGREALRRRFLRRGKDVPTDRLGRPISNAVADNFAAAMSCIYRLEHLCRDRDEVREWVDGLIARMPAPNVSSPFAREAELLALLSRKTSPPSGADLNELAKLYAHLKRRGRDTYTSGVMERVKGEYRGRVLLREFVAENDSADRGRKLMTTRS